MIHFSRVLGGANSSFVRTVVIVIALAAAAACSSSSSPEPATQDDSASSTEAGPSRSSGIGVEADVGALNKEEVLKAFDASKGGLMGCFEKGTRRVPFLGGRVKFHVRVDTGGAAKSAHLEESELGDRTTEDCMLGVLRARSWPAPQGGREGVAQTEFTFDPSGDVRAPHDWDASDAGKNVAAARAALGRCRRSASAGPIAATLYVETDGSVLSVGVSGADPQTEEAAACVVDALKAVKFNSPGSYAAKLRISE